MRLLLVVAVDVAAVDAVADHRVDVAVAATPVDPVYSVDASL